MKIIAVGMSFVSCGHDIVKSRQKEEPIIYLKPDSALQRGHKPFFVPDFSTDIHYSLALVYRLNRLGKNISPRFAYRYYDAITVGVDFMAKDMLSNARQKGCPWSLSVGFDASAVVGEYMAKEKFTDSLQLRFHLLVNGLTTQEGFTDNMFYQATELIAYVSRYMTVKTGDLLFITMPISRETAQIGQRFQGYLEDEKLFDFYIR